MAVNRYRVEKFSSVVGSFTTGEVTEQFGWWVWDLEFGREVVRCDTFCEAVFAAHRFCGR